VWGSDAWLGDLCVIGETVGRSLAPVPFVDHAVASRLLGSPALLAGESIGAISPRAAHDGVWSLVPSGAVADVVIGMDGAAFVAVSSPAPLSGPRNHASAPIADRGVLGEQHLVLGGREEFDQVMNEWKVLTASVLVGVASIALEIAVAYVQQREQFGVAIGSFQSVQHSLADLPGRIDAARLLAHEAAEAIEAQRSTGREGSCDVDNNDITNAGALASMAFLFASGVASDATARSLHFHGGYGFSEEYDIQLAYRRARGWALVLGDPTVERLALADRLWPSASTVPQ
jgi:alkylation response protein AidB-like acyl-CoA dehydrogenase